jgi:hypothetical protein
LTGALFYWGDPAALAADPDAADRLTKDHQVIQSQKPAVGLTTACVLWMCLGDPQNYHSAGAYRKAMGLNLSERSSGMHQGKLKLSKRGQRLPRPKKCKDSGVPLAGVRLPSGRHRDRKPLSSDVKAAEAIQQ